MKLLHVSIFLTAAWFVQGSREPAQLSHLVNHGDSFSQYLTDVFKDLVKIDGWKARVEKNYGEKESGHYCNENATGDICSAIGRKADNEQLDCNNHHKNRKGKKNYSAVSEHWEEKDSLKTFCCSKQYAQPFYYVEKAKNSDTFKKEKYKAYCDCIHKGEPAQGNGGLDCCSQYAVLDKKGKAVCGGIPPLGLNLPRLTSIAKELLPLQPSDCQYPAGGTVAEGIFTRPLKDMEYFQDFFDAYQKCGLRPCQRYGSKPTKDVDICCGSSNQKWDRPNDNMATDCKCAHAGTKLSPYTTATSSDCCSQSFVAGSKSRKCGCIPDNHELPATAIKSDCCSGDTTDRDNKKWCKVSTCTEQGQQITKHGEHCCAKDTTKITYELKKACGCVWGGLAPTDGLRSRCCSQAFLKDGKTCAWLDTGDPVKPHFNKSECFSGEANDGKQCVCMPPLSKKRDKKYVKENIDQCCSGSIIDDASSEYNGLCSCIKSGARSSDESHCCSGKVVGGFCACSAPGGRFSAAEGMTKADCCSKHASKNFCLCGPKDAKGDKVSCCAGTDEGTCKCIPDDQQVPPWETENPSAVCCNAGSKCSKTCGK